MRNKIYYLLDFNFKCATFSGYGDTYQYQYINHVNIKLNEYFSINEQKQLKLFNFNSDKLFEFGYNIVEDISFDNLDEQKLCDFFEDITHSYLI